MSIDITDPELAARFTAAPTSVLVRGPDGRALGMFVPDADPPTPIEELERRVNDPNSVWVTPEQVMERLREIDRCGR